MTQLNEALLGILACPNCRSSLVVDYEASELLCSKPECGLAYPVRDSIPILLVDEARAPSAGGGARGHRRRGRDPRGRPRRGRVTRVRRLAAGGS
jgi:uncharacterized protein YbaR (Trm112 family)